MKNHENLGMPLEVLWGTSVYIYIYRFLWIKYTKLERYERFVHPWLNLSSLKYQELINWITNGPPGLIPLS